MTTFLPKGMPNTGSIQPESTTSHLPEIYILIDTLPSGGKAYPAGATVKYRPYTFGEIKKLSQAKNVPVKESFMSALNGVQCSFDLLELTIPDALYIMLLRNISSVKNAELMLSDTCPKCGNKMRKELKLTEVEFQDLEAPQLPLTAKFGSKDLSFKPATLKMFFELIDESLDTDEIAMMAKQVINLEFKEAYDIISGLSDFDDLELISEIDKVMAHGIKPVLLPCKNKLKDGSICSFSKEVELDGGQALITPFRKRQESPRDRIRFGN